MAHDTEAENLFPARMLRPACVSNAPCGPKNHRRMTHQEVPMPL